MWLETELWLRKEEENGHGAKRKGLSGCGSSEGVIVIISGVAAGLPWALAGLTVVSLLKDPA